MEEHGAIDRKLMTVKLPQIDIRQWVSYLSTLISYCKGMGHKKVERYSYFMITQIMNIGQCSWAWQSFVDEVYKGTWMNLPTFLLWLFVLQAITMRLPLTVATTAYERTATSRRRRGAWIWTGCWRTWELVLSVCVCVFVCLKMHVGCRDLSPQVIDDDLWPNDRTLRPIRWWCCTVLLTTRREWIPHRSNGSRLSPLSRWKAKYILWWAVRLKDRHLNSVFKFGCFGFSRLTVVGMSWLPTLHHYIVPWILPFFVLCLCGCWWWFWLVHMSQLITGRQGPVSKCSLLCGCPGWWCHVAVIKHIL